MTLLMTLLLLGGGFCLLLGLFDWAAGKFTERDQ